MAYKTVDQIISENTSYKGASLYNAIVKAIKDGGLSGKAIPLNRNDANSKFKLAKATSRSGKSATREVTNFVIIDQGAFDSWFNSAKAGIRTTKVLNRAQMTMPSLEDIQAGKYTPEQLQEMATHVAGKRYGSHRAGPRKAKTTGTGKRGRPAKNAGKAAKDSK
jgi:hypothetical protein